MARSILLLWVVLISIQSLYRGLVYTYYVCNKAYIIEHLCENKAQPELKCAGKCHLKNVLQVQARPSEQQEQPFLPSLEEVKLPTLFFQQIARLTALCNAFLVPIPSKSWLDYQFRYAYEPLNGFWQPPRTV